MEVIEQVQTKDIRQLDEAVEGLYEEERELFYRMFSYEKRVGALIAPESFEDKAYCYLKAGDEKKEQTLKRVRRQVIIRTFNNYTGEQAQFNEIRTSRPGAGKVEASEEAKQRLCKQVDQEHENLKKDGRCDFCDPEKYTATDLEKRIVRENCISGANLAKYDSENGLIILNEPNPLRISREAFSDCLDLAGEWFKRIHEQNPERIYPFLGWNCLERAGASQIHAHMHTLLAPSCAYEKVERLRLASQEYRKETGSDYFEDLFSVHEFLDLSFEYSSARVLASLVPRKDKDVWIMGSNLDDLKEPCYKVVRCFIDQLGVQAFNFAIQMPPLYGARGWEGFPYIARIIDRGPAFKKGTDMGVMEMFATPIIGSDPFKVADSLRKNM